MPLFALTLLLSAFLLFLVQPVIAKLLLPWFGGSAAVWTVCMVFFQVALLAGYAYAHALTRWLAARRQAQVHVVLLVASLLWLPILPAATLAPAPGADATAALLRLLVRTVGLPYLMLATTGPLLQRWVAHRFAPKSVYRLFALSNFGSLLGLLAFPFVIEPMLSGTLQAWSWSGAYALFAAASGTEAILAARRGDRQAAAALIEGDARDFARHFHDLHWLGRAVVWVALSALGSILLLAATSHMTQNVATVPFLWVVPLSLYLLSFVAAFEGPGGRSLYDPRWGAPLALLSVVLMAVSLGANHGVLDLGLSVPLFCAGIFLTCLFCHGELARLRPGEEELTLFYLCLAFGGAAGGALVGLAAPRILNMTIELPIALFLLAAAVLLRTLATAGRAGWRGAITVAAIAAAYVTAQQGLAYRDFLRRDAITMRRNFYGTLRVRQVEGKGVVIRRLMHGVILHGEQVMSGPRRVQPISYYGASSGLGRAIDAVEARGGPVSIGVVGLGTGTIAAYGRPGDHLCYYEIDPDVLDLARHEFTYLADSPAEKRFVLGDARLSLGRELAAGGSPGFDVLAIDAFSSDSIPVHLITREAVALDLQALAPNGILALHISNRFLDLRPVVANIAASLGLSARLVHDHQEDDALFASTEWALLARDPATLAVTPIAGHDESLAPDPRRSVWTDQANNLFEVLKVHPLDALLEQAQALRSWLGGLVT